LPIADLVGGFEDQPFRRELQKRAPKLGIRRSETRLQNAQIRSRLAEQAASKAAPAEPRKRKAKAKR
jgi:hypothetical protein